MVVIVKEQCLTSRTSRRPVTPIGLMFLGAAVFTWVIVGISSVPAADLWARWAGFEETSTVAIDHSEWQSLLSEFVQPGENGQPNRVNYRAFADDEAARDSLELYITSLEAVEVETLNRDEQFAFWANLYNAATVRVVLDHYPVSSIRKIGISPGLFTRGPWGAKLVRVDGEHLTLDDIEHRILRPGWKDPRVHYAVNCASIGCPNLPTKPFTGKTLEADLEAAASAYINSSRGAYFDDDDLTVSKIYDWYAEDFGNSDSNIIAHLKRYAKGDVLTGLKGADRIGAYDYDWALNDTATE